MILNNSPLNLVGTRQLSAESNKLGAVHKRCPQRGRGLSKVDVCGRGGGFGGNADVRKILGILHKIRYKS